MTTMHLPVNTPVTNVLIEVPQVLVQIIIGVGVVRFPA